MILFHTFIFDRRDAPIRSGPSHTYLVNTFGQNIFFLNFVICTLGAMIFKGMGFLSGHGIKTVIVNKITVILEMGFEPVI